MATEIVFHTLIALKETDSRRFFSNILRGLIPRALLFYTTGVLFASQVEKMSSHPGGVA